MAHKCYKPVSVSEILTQYSKFIKAIHGNDSPTLEVLVPPETPHPQGISFLKDPKHLDQILTIEKGVLVLPENSVPQEIPNSIQTLIESTNTEYLMAEIIHNYFQETPYRSQAQGVGVHPTATVHPSAKLGQGVQIGPGAVIGAHVEIANNVFIGSHSVIESRTHIGEHTTIHPLAYIGHGTEIGSYVDIHPHTTIGCEGFGYSHTHLGQHRRIPHIGKVIIEDHVHIGASCAIDRGTLGVTQIGEGTKIDNQCHIAHNSIIGKHCLITAQFVCGGSAKIGNHFVCGGKTVVAGHKKVGDQVQVAALSVISNDQEQAGQFGGYPLQPLNDFLKAKASFVHLVEIRKNVKKLMKAVFKES